MPMPIAHGQFHELERGNGEAWHICLACQRPQHLAWRCVTMAISTLTPSNR